MVLNYEKKKDFSLFFFVLIYFLWKKANLLLNTSILKIFDLRSDFFIMHIKFILFKFFYFIIYSNLSNLVSIYIKDFFFLFFIRYLKKSSFTSIKLLMDICVVDYIFKLKRFKVIYNFLNIMPGKRLLINFFIKEEDEIFSLSNLFKSSVWIEREIFDMFGIFFLNNNDLRRILCDYGFKGYPLKKDFPLTGFLEVIYSDSFLDVIYKPIQLAQDFRFFNFSSNWENLYF